MVIFNIEVSIMHRYVEYRSAEGRCAIELHFDRETVYTRPLRAIRQAFLLGEFVLPT